MTENEAKTLADVMAQRSETDNSVSQAARRALSHTSNEPDERELAWQAWREAWNERGSTSDMSELEESTARTRFERWWSRNHD